MSPTSEGDSSPVVRLEPGTRWRRVWGDAAGEVVEVIEVGADSVRVRGPSGAVQDYPSKRRFLDAFVTA